MFELEWKLPWSEDEYAIIEQDKRKKEIPIRNDERNKVLDEVLEAICDGPPSDNGVESMDRICGILERIRKKGNTEDR